MKKIDIQGMSFYVREENYDDEYTVNEVIRDNCYKLKPEWIKNKVVIDAGANIGDFSVLCWKLGARKVIAFEPEPNNFEILKLNIAVNGADVDIRNEALGITGTTFIDNSSGHSQTGRITGSPVKVVSLNDVVDSLDSFVFKMDVEGAEYDIIETATDETMLKIERIIGELHSWRWDEEPERHKNLILKLEKYFSLSYDGYKNSNIQGKNKMIKQK